MAKKTKRPAAKPARTGKSARVVGATPSGWSFFATFLRCKWSWFLKYYRGIVPLTTPEHFLIGSAYHALHEGLSDKEIRAELPELTDEMLAFAKELYQARLDGPAMPEPLAREKLFRVADGPAQGFTSKPDVIERDEAAAVETIREFKTAMVLRDTDQMYWQVAGSVIGEMYATGLANVTVDIVGKNDQHVVRQIQVGMTKEKRKAFEDLIADTKNDIAQRINATKMDYGSSTALVSMDFFAERHFPKNFDACVSNGYVCPYYARCWEPDSREAKLYKRTPTTHGWKKTLGI